MESTDHSGNQNVTLSLPKDLLRKARLVAVQRGISLSSLLRQYMSSALRDDERYQRARERALARLRAGVPLGAGEKPAWSRDSLHER